MEVLLDEHLPHELRPLLIGHDAYTVGYLGWAGTTNGAPLRGAALDGFDVLLSQDSSIEHQHNRHTLPLAVLLISAGKSDLDVLKP